MADIDKALPNTNKVEIERPEQEIDLIDQGTPSNMPFEVTQLDDGGVELDYDQGNRIPGTEQHFDNLAELLPDDILEPIGSEMQSNYMDYKQSRKDWEDSYTKGLDLLGFKYDNRSEPFQGASGATHPVLAEAVTQFQAGAYKELLPAEGPVRTQILGVSDQPKEQQSQRVKDFMNYQIMDIMKEYEPEFDQMLNLLKVNEITFDQILVHILS